MNVPLRAQRSDAAAVAVVVAADVVVAAADEVSEAAEEALVEVLGTLAAAPPASDGR